MRGAEGLQREHELRAVQLAICAILALFAIAKVGIGIGTVDLICIEKSAEGQEGQHYQQAYGDLAEPFQLEFLAYIKESYSGDQQGGQIDEETD